MRLAVRASDEDEARGGGEKQRPVLNEQRCALFYDTVRPPPRLGSHFGVLARTLGLRLCGFFFLNSKAQLNHGTRFETMAILVKALKCATKRLRAFP